MLRLASVFGLSLLALTAVALSTQPVSTNMVLSRGKGSPKKKRTNDDWRAVLPGARLPAYYAPFSLN